MKALSSGRYISKAPVGYLNVRDNENKPLIVVDKEKAITINKIFEMYLNDVPLKGIYNYAKIHSINLKGHSAIRRILSNPTYAGMVRVPAYKKDLEKIKKGVHEPIVTEYEFWEVQRKLGLLKEPNRTVLNEEVPLRAVLKCSCGKPLTAGRSKGKKDYYWYYKCSAHPERSLSAKKLHHQLEEIWSLLSLDNYYLEYLYQSAYRQMEQETTLKGERLRSVRTEYRKVLEKLESVENKYISNSINNETYQKWHSKYKRDESALKYEFELLRNKNNKFWKLYVEVLPKLLDMNYIYTISTIEQKQILIKQVFSSDLRYDNGVYRTPFLASLFEPKAALLKEKRLLIYEKPLLILGKNPVSAPGGT